MKQSVHNKPYHVAAIVFLALFLILTALLLTTDVQPVGPGGSRVGLATLNVKARAALDGGRWLVDSVDGGESFFNQKLFDLTEKVGLASFLICAVFGCIGLYQLCTRKSLKQVDPELIALGVIYVISGILYLAFKKVEINFRPAVVDLVEGLEPSFPSSHTMEAIAAPFSAIFVIRIRWRGKPLATVAACLCAVLMVVLLVGRLLSGVHWLTDILGGLFIGLSLVSLFLYMAARLKEKWR